MDDTKKMVIILDMQPIDPPIGGGRLRLLGLYHNLGSNLDARYIGTYDWPGEEFRDHQLSDSLREVNIPLSDDHFAEVRKRQEQVGGKTIIDTTFPQLAYLSPQFVNYVRNEVVKADAVVFSHPWVYPLVKDLLNNAQTVIYDSQNVEGYLRYALLDDGGLGTAIVREVVKTEYELCHTAAVVLACSQEDRDLFNKLYDVPMSKMKVVPNGVFTEKIKPLATADRVILKAKLGLADHKAAIFIGSNYPPNLEASRFIINDLAPAIPELTFIIAGGVGEGINSNSMNVGGNIKVTGILTDEEKLSYLAASDLAINPMFSGSGTNIKMFDFMAAGMPVISTGTGSRGITNSDYAGIIISDKSEFALCLRGLVNDDLHIQNLGEMNREFVETNFSWEKISPKLGAFLANQIVAKKNSANGEVELRKKPKIALMSSWNIRCGIAEHSRCLSDEFGSYGVDFRIIANSNGDLTSNYLIDDIPRNIYPLWNYDYVQWKDTKIDITEILHTLASEGITQLNIQYHTGFYQQRMLIEMANACVKANLEVSIALHNSKELFPETLLDLSNLGSKLIVHTSEEKSLLQRQGFQNVFRIPLGVLDFPDEDTLDCRKDLGIFGHPVIGSFGFLRPHKGVLEAIEAVGILRDKYPNIKFLGINALYPSRDSEQYNKTCLARIDELHLNENIMLLTSFLKMRQIIHYLHAADIIVMPYHESKEGSSAAANTAISAKRPLIMSKSGIFSEVKHVAHEMDDIKPSTIAADIQNLVTAPELLGKMKNKVIDYVNENSYWRIAGKYIDLLLGE